MVIVVFRARFKPGAALDAYGKLSQRMHDLVARHPGYISIESSDGEDGTEVAVSMFETAESAQAWKEHPEHLEAQRRGREQFYEWYTVHVCEVIRSHEFPAPALGAGAG